MVPPIVAGAAQFQRITGSLVGADQAPSNPSNAKKAPRVRDWGRNRCQKNFKEPSTHPEKSQIKQIFDLGYWIPQPTRLHAESGKGGPWPTFRIAAGPFGLAPYLDGSDGGLKRTLRIHTASWAYRRRNRRALGTSAGEASSVRDARIHHGRALPWEPAITRSPKVPPATPGNSPPVGIAPSAPLGLCVFALNSGRVTLRDLSDLRAETRAMDPGQSG